MPGCEVIIEGVVQGVGFRPFVYRTAMKHNMKGYVRNSGNGVDIWAEGKKEDIETFLRALQDDVPPLASVNMLRAKWGEEKGQQEFQVKKSTRKGSTGSVIPPDVTLCDKCLIEILDPDNRRHLYPFTVCTDCGPRYTVIESLPYDRENTTMAPFPMCMNCEKEYMEPSDRRYRAEPTACPGCGPVYGFYEGRKKNAVDDPLRAAAEALDRGSIVAIKGVGGTHLATKVTADDALLKIRALLGRPTKPFAVMARDIKAAREIGLVGPDEKRLLTSYQRPIVVVDKGEASISDLISPGLHNIGVMLPYSGVHHVLFHYSKEPAFVMTSANIPGEPMALVKDDILGIGADYALIHNRQIRNRCDDSVIRMVAGRPTFLRRSRGWVPMPVEVDIGNDKTILALGPELDVTACLLKGDRAFLSQYVGNTTKLSTLDYLKEAVENIMELTRTDSLDAVAVDMHPGFNTVHMGGELAKRFDCQVVRVQHHHSHAASLMAEEGVEKIVCIATDGVGYGTDGLPWGGEVLVADYEDFERVGSLVPQPMAGGDMAARYPLRMAAGLMWGRYGEDEITRFLRGSDYRFKKGEVDIILKQLERGINTPMSTSTGRVLDAAAAMLGICYERTYEGEPAIMLEALAARGKDELDFKVKIRDNDSGMELDTSDLFHQAYGVIGDEKPEDIAASFQGALADGFGLMALKAAGQKGIDVVGLSGGVGANHAIVRVVRDRIEGAGMRFVVHTKVPCGDGGVSLGQAAVAARRLAK